MNLPAFYADAECDGMDTSLFFPWSPRSRPSPLAVKACSRCGVREECLSFSLAPFQAGVRGGMTEEQRLAERKRRHIQRQTDQRRAERAAVREQDLTEGAAA